MLTVLSVAYPLAPVGQSAVGGAEQILSALDARLTGNGHRSIVIACEGSTVAGDLAAFPASSPPFDAGARRAAQARAASLVSRLAPAADIVHMHGIDFDAYLPPPGPPALATLHLPPSWYSATALDPPRGRTWLNCVSRSQDDAMQGVAHTPHVLEPVPNGVDVARLSAVRCSPRRYALMLGRICPEKGQHLALAAAHAADIPLLIGGLAYPYPEHEAYFRHEVTPLLDARRRWLGPVGFARKRRLLAGARCTLLPSLAPETSSLVAMESLACGTPVIAFPVGALPELVEHGRTGLLVQNIAEMVDAIGVVGSICRDDCRAAARARFDIGTTVNRYIAHYETLLRQ